MFNVSARLRSLKRTIRLNLAMRELRGRPEAPEGARKHDLPKPLVVSLTSYRGRFDTLALSLRSILFQTVRPDLTILWVSHDDFPVVPSEVLALRRYGLEIAACVDIRSYKKIVPTLQNHEDCFIITVDDDLYYTQDCIETLTKAYRPDSKHIVTRRAHKVTVQRGGGLAPYRSWKRDISRPATSERIFPTGGFGTLYPPGAFHDDVTDASLFMELCKSADDVWLYWMWRMNGHLGQKVASNTRIVEWPGSQASALQRENVGGGENDRCIQNMIKRYGMPI